MEVRVRYAPSPTGLQHIGGVRTALFNYLFARSLGGKFILRLEDTDRTRTTDEAVKNLYDTFEWLGVKWDEGPDVGGPYASYIQSERSGLYGKYALELVAMDKAYYCFCDSARLDRIRKEREDSKSSETGYDRHCRAVPAAEAASRAAAGEPHVIRLKIPLGEKTLFRDHLLGDIEWKNDDVNPDPVLLKSDGFPTYHLANVVDDHLMKITHVLRAQEWLPSTPLHVIMYRAFGWEHPEFCHLPMVMGQDGKKLSKRHGSTSVDEFRNQGYLPEALLNYVALLGASYEEGRDIFSLEELARLFRLEKLNKAPAVFDYKKLEWFNGQYIRLRSDAELAELALPYAVSGGLFGPAGTTPSAAQKAAFIAALPLVKERLSFLHEIPGKLGYLFSEPAIPAAEEFIPKKLDLARAIELLELGRALVSAMAGESDAAAEERVKAAAETAGAKLGDFMMPLRVAVTGSRVSPPLFGSLRILGAEKVIARVDRALGSLKNA
ncbi:MAG TPA: glutamate--tRNA ligase [Treponema sp.]|nr:MAG: glutamate--tRNA ligase [Treponema sp. GWA1_62_8]OHE64781.1 MAG: glutamate--tRNA ligase [Treponema sp. GWC1_61_84]OHE71999.1 MAG: glutamate--tRNA ligase [Treponema sp. RIFOXYC1_FULL_61_9]HCM27625.1 glutamate--tRNA ligase [Treponema sp.]